MFMTDKNGNLKRSTFLTVISITTPILFAVMAFYAWFVNVQLADMKIEIKEIRTEQVEIGKAVVRIEEQLKIHDTPLTFNK